MPQHARGDRSPRTPGARDAADSSVVRQRAQAFDFAHRGDESEIAGGPDIGAPEGHQEIDVRGPCTDASELDERGSRLVIVERRERVGIEFARDDGLRDVSDVGAFLPSESGATQIGLAHSSDPVGSYGAGQSLQPQVGGAARRERYLLLENDLDQGLEALWSIPQRGRAVARDDRGEVRVPPRELRHSLGKAVRG